MYPAIEDSDFYNKINKKYEKYYTTKKKPSFNSICFPKDYQLQLPQQFLAKYINPATPYKGVLIFHRIGAGKTCTAVRIGETWKHQRKIMVLTPASLVGNFRNELRSPCAGNSYLTDKERKELANYHPSSKEYKEIIKISDDRINKCYKIYSYNKFVELAEEGKISLKNTVLIVDEIQNMVSDKGKFYKVLYDAIHSAPQDLRIVLLSATPMFDKPIEIGLTMNLLRIPYELPTGREFEKTFMRVSKNKTTGKVFANAINLDVFQERIKGYVSYFKGAPDIAFPSFKVRHVKCEMSEFQYRSYLSVLAKETQEHHGKLRAFKNGDILELPNNFFIGTRIISNVAFPNKGVEEDGLTSFKGSHLKLENLQKYSIKFFTIITKIKNSWGPILVYSNFKEYGGIKSFVRALEAQGFSDYTKTGEGRSRYAVWTGDVNNNTREEIKSVFNQTSNYNGSKLKVMILSPSAKEGVSFFNVQQIHILEPYWNQARIDQIMGRGIRYCSHKNLPEEKRHVKVYIYMAVHPQEAETVDQYITKLANQKNKLIQQFDKAMKEAAVDCTLFKNANELAGETDLVCVK
jgi:superfamily II DNA or RNA helicase